MATKQLTTSDTYVIPRVNLLPPEIAAKRAERKSYAVMGVAVAAAGAAVAVLYLGQTARVAAAQDELAQTQADGARLKAQRAKLQPVLDVYAAVDADEAILTRVLSDRVLWSVQLHNLSISMPENVWITQFSGAVGAPGADAAGTLTFAGRAFEYDDVAAWLESVAKLKGVTGASFSSATKVLATSPKGRSIVSFSSTASLTPAAVTPHKKPGSR